MPFVDGHRSSLLIIIQRERHANLLESREGRSYPAVGNQRAVLCFRVVITPPSYDRTTALSRIEANYPTQERAVE